MGSICGCVGVWVCGCVGVWVRSEVVSLTLGGREGMES